MYQQPSFSKFSSSPFFAYPGNSSRLGDLVVSIPTLMSSVCTHPTPPPGRRS